VFGAIRYAGSAAGPLASVKREISGLTSLIGTPTIRRPRSHTDTDPARDRAPRIVIHQIDRVEVDTVHLDPHLSPVRMSGERQVDGPRACSDGKTSGLCVRRTPEHLRIDAGQRSRKVGEIRSPLPSSFDSDDRHRFPLMRRMRCSFGEHVDAAVAHRRRNLRAVA